MVEAKEKIEKTFPAAIARVIDSYKLAINRPLLLLLVLMGRYYF